jgi:hypothetical protein
LIRWRMIQKIAHPQAPIRAARIAKNMNITPPR